MNPISRRGFLTLTGTSFIGSMTGLKFGTALADTELPRPEKIRYAKETTTICPYCAVGCGQIVSVRDGKVVHIEGDPDHPVNEGALCSKGMSLYQVINNERRLTHVLYRAPGSTAWEKKSWDWALPRMVQLIKKTRDETFRATENDRPVNRTEGIACLGGAALDNEECYLYSKFARALGIVYLEHQARI
jgi:formate dehydrogenase major subunit